ncbi:transmembrane emp24 domain-containing protein 1 isoform X2 [Eurytemora carolleeae]|uniref:transmembrane emp24 domain-containing protein 1 isoform X2 n=1 Tax=Eurytemora carolleeae TaxID=1294199 RepID=UPI000C771E87|nr:transmembrane emp24 domain-containing protein 1 isoform X2 [Eurytemora carolleeae]|eukprot:XP_023337367.1 transmembrane emp24 domain-containing protein 1-like isoform X2 [Eurytemora affinis]
MAPHPVQIIIILLISCLSLAKEQDMTVEVGAGMEECFFETVNSGFTFTVEYQVVDGGSGQYSELDINFRVMHPRGHPLVAEFKKSDGVFSQTVKDSGDYKICFENKFSYVSSKTIYFEVINENEDIDYDDFAAIFSEEEEPEIYELQVSDIEDKLKKIKDDMEKARHLQDMIRVTDLKDRSLAEHNFERVNFMSIIYLVVLLRSLFDEKSKINPLWKKAFQD